MALQIGMPGVSANKWYIIWDSIFTSSSGAALIGRATQDRETGRAVLTDVYTLTPVNVSWNYILFWGFTGRAEIQRDPNKQHVHAFSKLDPQESYVVLSPAGRAQVFENVFKDNNVWTEFKHDVPQDVSRPLV